MNTIDFTELGLSEKQAEEASGYNGCFIARVAARYKGSYKIITVEGECRAVISGKLQHGAQDALYPAVGDFVLADRPNDLDGAALILRVLPRKSCLARKAAGTRPYEQVIAANIDTVFVCMAPDRDFNLRRIERYLTMVWESMSSPVIVLTKSDLAGAADARIPELYQVAAGVDIVMASAFSPEGLEALRPYMDRGKTVAFIGSSGVGKSTLINRLLGEERLATGEVRAGDGRGRHTTTTRELFMLPGGGIVIDTPGMRELQLSGGDLSGAFADIEELAGRCRFRDCGHESEPGCAVRQALEEGRISAKRLESYRKLQNEMLYRERRGSLTAAQAEKQKFIGMMGSLGAFKKMLQENPKYKK